MTEFLVIEAKPHHCGQMARKLRLEHMEVVAQMGIDSHRELRARFDDSAFRRAWFIDGKLSAIGGVTGSQLAPYGFVWLAISNDAMKYRLAMVKEARRQLDEIMVIKCELCTTILDGDEASKRFAIFLGFVPSDDDTVAPASSRYGRHYVSQKFDMTVNARVPVGKGYGTVVAYQRGI